MAAVGEVPGDARRWGLGDVWLGIAGSIAVVILVGSAIIAVGGYDDFDEAPMWLFSLANAPLHLTMLVVAVWAVTTKGRGVVNDLGLEFKVNDIGTGLLAGVLAQFILVPAVTYPIIWATNTDSDEISESARELADRATNAPGVIALVFTTVILAPVVEEIFFRGLAFEAYKKRRNLPWLEQVLPGRLRPNTASGRWNPWVAALLSSAIFSAVHFQPLLSPALFAAGLVFAWLAQRHQRLGAAIWAHAAFNATTVISLLAID